VAPNLLLIYLFTEVGDSGACTLQEIQAIDNAMKKMKFGQGVS